MSWEHVHKGMRQTIQPKGQTRPDMSPMLVGLALPTLGGAGLFTSLTFIGEHTFASQLHNFHALGLNEFVFSAGVGAVVGLLYGLNAYRRVGKNIQ